ncbi:hypothetical protein AGMMS50293_16870 [Spirochaetia bacterium]|nr:hypothetical protein AGMMS50293_16870 [Spirochaetia bacterium]
MNKKIIFAVLAVLVLGALPLAAQNSPAGGLATGNVINRDLDTYMLVNFAPFLAYDKFFTFGQASVNGIQAGYATKIGGGFFNFYLSGSGFSFSDKVRKTNDGTKTYEEPSTLDGSGDTGPGFNLQFDTIYGRPDMGVFKLGLNFDGVGKDEDLTEYAANDDYIKAITNSGTITPSIAFGKNFIHDDYSMLLVNGEVSLRIPTNNENIVKIKPDPVFTVPTTTTTSANATRLEVKPGMWYFFKPKLEPVTTITSIYLLDTFVMEFSPQDYQKIEIPGYLMDVSTKFDRTYIANTLFGYVNSQYYLTSRFSLAWRLNYSIGFYSNKYETVVTSTTAGTPTTVTELSADAFYLVLAVAPRLAFSYQAVPATLTLTGAVVLNSLGNANMIGWQYMRTKTDTKIYNLAPIDTVTTDERNTFTGINATFSMGAAWNLSPRLALESGFSLNTAGLASLLSSVNIAAVYKW